MDKQNRMTSLNASELLKALSTLQQHSLVSEEQELSFGQPQG
jgi:hypothetical protein